MGFGILDTLKFEQYIQEANCRAFGTYLDHRNDPASDNSCIFQIWDGWVRGDVGETTKKVDIREPSDSVGSQRHSRDFVDIEDSGERGVAVV